MSYKKIQFPHQNTQFWNPRVSLYSVFSLAALTLDTNVRVSVKLPDNLNAFTFRSKSWNCNQTASGFSSIVEVSMTFLLGVRLYMQRLLKETLLMVRTPGFLVGQAVNQENDSGIS